MIADMFDVVIGVDTHKDTHTYAVLDAQTGAVMESFSTRADAAGYAEALEHAALIAPGAIRLWAIEGTKSYGAGLTRHLFDLCEQVAEVDHPHKRPKGERRGKSDEIDAVAAARSVLARENLSTPRAFGSREVLRVLVVSRDGAVSAANDALRQLRSLIVTAPEPLRERLFATGRAALVSQVLALRPPRTDPERAAFVGVLRSIAQRVAFNDEQARAHHTQISSWVREICPELVEKPGVGPVSAAQILISWSHPGRFRSEACYARLGGIPPIPASSGMTTRHRLDPGGDRRLNSAIHTIAVTRMRCDEKTRDYVAKRTAMGSSPRDTRRILKRHIIRGLFRLVEATATPDTPRSHSATPPSS
jgi:transposase